MNQPRVIIAQCRVAIARSHDKSPNISRAAVHAPDQNRNMIQSQDKREEIMTNFRAGDTVAIVPDIDEAANEVEDVQLPENIGAGVGPMNVAATTIDPENEN